VGLNSRCQQGCKVKEWFKRWRCGLTSKSGVSAEGEAERALLGGEEGAESDGVDGSYVAAPAAPGRIRLLHRLRQ
jgi:hypothetical protein